MTLGPSDMATKSPNPERKRLETSWRRVSARFTTASDADWAYGGEQSEDGPEFGWKLHVSATITNAAGVLRAVGPYLKRDGVCFKVPRTLSVLARINQGIGPSYCQVGKFLTVYPSNEFEAVRLARELDALTSRFTGPVIPFDRRLHERSQVYYRFGAFVSKSSDEDWIVVNGRTVADDRRNPVPAGIDDPFQLGSESAVDRSADIFSSRFRVFDAFSQRGKGGAYHAIDTFGDNPRIVVVKEGRRDGETSWDGSDGFDLTANEFTALSELFLAGVPVPRPIEFFEYGRNAYCAIEAIKGVSLEAYLERRVRRLSVRRAIGISLMIADVLISIESAGWRWGDCKPANLIICPDGSIRPIDFEGAHRLGTVNRFGLQSIGFSDPKRGDSYSLGAVMYHLITGDRIGAGRPVRLGSPRRTVPATLSRLIDELLSGELDSIRVARKKLLRILGEMSKVGAFQNTIKAGVIADAGSDGINHPTRKVGEAFLA